MAGLPAARFFESWPAETDPTRTIDLPGGPADPDLPAPRPSGKLALPHVYTPADRRCVAAPSSYERVQ
jgi:hypothetical protein